LGQLSDVLMTRALQKTCCSRDELRSALITTLDTIDDKGYFRFMEAGSSTILHDDAILPLNFYLSSL
jgi:hypothetical protein